METLLIVTHETYSSFLKSARRWHAVETEWEYPCYVKEFLEHRIVICSHGYGSEDELREQVIFIISTVLKQWKLKKLYVASCVFGLPWRRVPRKVIGVEFSHADYGSYPLVDALMDLVDSPSSIRFEHCFSFFKKR